MPETPDIFSDLANAYLGTSSAPRAKSQYDPLFEKYGQANGVDPDLLRAQTGQESTYDPNAV